jgi:phosphohistidine phosphatase
MKQLILMRHAEAEPARDGLDDMQRQLSAQGRTDALDAALCLAQTEIRLDSLLISPAQRTRETAVIVAAQLDITRPLLFEPELYPGHPAALLSVLRRLPRSQQCVLLVGHNPGLSDLASQFANAGQRIALRTSGVCSIHLQGDSWNELQPLTTDSVALWR